MPFPAKLLNDDEQVVLDLHPHWSTLARPILVVMIAAAVTIVLAEIGRWPALVGGVLLGFSLWRFVIRYLRWTTTNFVVTTDRIVYRAGVIAKHGKEIPLERVNDIAFHQTVWERMIGAGDLSIESAGAQSRETFEDIPRPAQVQNEVYRQMEAAADRHADRAAGRAAPAPEPPAASTLSIPEQIDQLDQLRQRGAITQAEFDAKKRQLLDRL